MPELTKNDEGRLREILRRRRVEIAAGLASSDPRELADLLAAFWNVIAPHRSHLLRTIRRRAGNAGLGYDFEHAEDVLQTTLVKVCLSLKEDYTNGPQADGDDFVFDPEGELSIVAWVDCTIGTAYGRRPGVLQTYLTRQKREHERMELPSQGEDPDIRDDQPGMALDVEDVSYFNETLRQMTRALRRLEAKKRFAITAWIGVKSGGVRSNDEAFDWFKSLINDIWDDEGRRARLALAGQRALSGAEIVKGEALATISHVICQCERQVERWCDDFLDEFRASVRWEPPLRSKAAPSRQGQGKGIPLASARGRRASPPPRTCLEAESKRSSKCLAPSQPCSNGA